MIAAAMLIQAGPAMGSEVYKVVDEHGNVSWTDLPPTPDSEPEKLQSLNVIEVPERELPASDDPGHGTATDSEADGPEEIAYLRTLRREYSDFRIIRPVENQTFRGQTSPATLAWDTGKPLQPGMSVVFYINDYPLMATREQVISTGSLARGEHQVRAELLSPRNRRVASADEVTFHIHQAYNWIDLPNTEIR
jgi:hypothetical protein